MATTPIQLLRQVAALLTANATLVSGRHTPVSAATSGKNMTLPTPGGAGRYISVEKTDSSANFVNITGNIRGVPNTTISLLWERECIVMVSDAAGSWWPYADHKTKASLDANYLPKWRPLTTYAVGDVVLAPDGSVVRRTAAGTSTATYTSTNWTSIASDSTTALGAVIAAETTRAMEAEANLGALIGQGGGTATVTADSMITALSDGGRILQSQFLAVSEATDSASRDQFSSILGLQRIPEVGKVLVNRDFTAATATTATRPFGTDTVKTIVRWRATDGTTTVPTNFIASNDEIYIIRPA